VIDRLGRVVLGLDQGVVVGEDDVDAAVPFGERCCETRDGVAVGGVDTAPWRALGRRWRSCRCARCRRR
jgi:hypothetical protein